MNINVVALDETRYWELPERFKPHVERIETVYAYDKNLAVHCCELTPSHELWPVETRAVTTDDASEQMRDAISEMVLGQEPPEVIYMHVGSVRELVKTLKRDRFRAMRFRKAPMEDITQALRENSAL